MTNPVSDPLLPPRIDWDLGRLRLFVRIAHEGSLTRAASALGLPQPAVSRKLARLEEECGGRLFLRTGRGVALSELGKRLMPRVQAVLAALGELEDEVSERAGSPVGEVRIGALPSLHQLLVVPLLKAQMARFPGIRMHVQEGSGGQIDQWLSHGLVDIGLTYRYGRKASGDAERLVRVGSFLVGAPGDPLTRAKTIEFRRLDRLPLVLPSAPSAVRLVLDQLAARAGIVLNVVMEADSGQIQKGSAAHAGTYTVLPLHAMADELRSGSLQAARIVEPRIDRDIAMGMTSARAVSRAAREVARLVREIMASDEARSAWGAAER